MVQYILWFWKIKKKMFSFEIFEAKILSRIIDM